MILAFLQEQKKETGYFLELRVTTCPYSPLNYFRPETHAFMLPIRLLPYILLQSGSSILINRDFSSFPSVHLVPAIFRDCRLLKKETIK